MKLNFDSNQQYQIEAIKAVTDIFKGQPLHSGEFEVSFSGINNSLPMFASGTRNNILISESQILLNLQEIQKRNGIEISQKLDGLNFSVEMETGTGKTYVYLRTIYELNKQYGFKKFVIVVPSIAIKEGVLKNLEITNKHFQDLYDKVPVAYKVYDSSKVSSLRSFADSTNIQILVINIDSFAKDENIVNKNNDKLTGKQPIEFIQITNPIVIVDEPQNMETDIRKKAISNLNPACTLRYSATHKNLYNLVYSLNPVKAYDMGLVKQIEVDSVISQDDHNSAFIELEKFISNKKSISVKIKIELQTETEIKQKSITVKSGDDLYNLSNKREIYKDNFILNNIDVTERFIEFANGIVIRIGQNNSPIRDEIMKSQIESTIREHLSKEKQLNPKGIKVLSLFFIDRVANYRSYDENRNIIKGKIYKWFEEIYNKLIALEQYKNITKFDIDKIHKGYFSQDKKGNLKDSNENRETQDDNDTYKIIMQNKEELLDINNPVKFIFSHSALKEGWDNPNVFQICTLNETKSLMKKRQEIGRGLRLAVDNNGNRIHDKNINKLTVIANETYKDFAFNLQKELEDNCNVSFEGRIKEKRKRKTVKLKKGFELDKNFIELWNKIKHKTTYRVDYDSQDLINKACERLEEIKDIIKTPQIISQKTSLQINDIGISGQALSTYSKNVDTSFEVPNIIDYIQSRLSSKLTRKTIISIIKQSDSFKYILKNPQMFLDLAISKINNVVNELMVNGIKYQKIAGQEWEMMLFKDTEIESYIENLYEVKKQEKTITDNIVIDSLSSPEIQFAKDCENNENVDFFVKLPNWFKIKTPIGTYNPDWALIYKNDRKIYFVAETKSTLDLDKLRLEEKLKIKCGKAHFKDFEDVEFKHTKDLQSLI